MKEEFLRKIISTKIQRCFVLGEGCKFLYERRCFFNIRSSIDIEKLQYSECPRKRKLGEEVEIR